MTGNLESQYEQILEAIKQYKHYADKVTQRLFRFRTGRKGWGLIIMKWPETWREVNPLSGRTPNWLTKMISQNASEDEKRNEYFQALSNQFRTDTLCDYLVTRFPDFDFQKLKELHDLKEVQLLRFHYFKEHGILFAAATVLLKTVPRSVVQPYLKYSVYETIVFWLTVFVLLYLVILAMPFWIRHRNAKDFHALVGDLLSYIAIKQGKKADNG